MNLNRKWAFAGVLALGTAVGVAAAGCGDDSTSSPATPKDSGTGQDSTTPGVDSGLPGTDGGSPDSATTTLYERLGGYSGIHSAVVDVVTNVMNGELTDAQIASYFFIRTGGFANPGGAAAGGDPSPDAVIECFTLLVANATGGTEQYPSTAMFDGGGTFACRDMGTAHNGLHVTAGAFSKFIAIAAARLAADGVGSADLTTLGGALLGTQGMIVDAKREGQLTEAGVDGAVIYGARCADIDGGAVTAPGCTTTAYVAP